MSASALQHDSGCLRQWIVGISLKSGRIFTFPSYRKRWDCNGCLPRKLSETLTPIFTDGLELVLVWEGAVNIRRRAARLKAGYAAFSYTQCSNRLLIAEHKLFPELPTLNPPEIALECLEYGMVHTVARLSFNQYMRPDEPDAAEVLPVMTYTTDFQIVQKAIYDAGFGNGTVGRTTPEIAARRIRARFGEVDWDEFGTET